MVQGGRIAQPMPIYFETGLRHAAKVEAEAYRWCGYSFLGNLAMEKPTDINEREWGHRLDHLGALLAADDTNPDVVSWLVAYLPGFIAAVPHEQRSSFIQGMRMRYQQDEVA